MPDDEPVRVFLGLGSNLGDRAKTLETAIRRLDGLDGATVSQRSSFIRTQPWGKTDQPWFLNAVVAVETTLAPRALLEACQSIEKKLGRTRDVKWGPRTIDIDILLYGDHEIDEPGLTIPHPFLIERDFVLQPLAELAPDAIVAGKTVSAHLAALAES